MYREKGTENCWHEKVDGLVQPQNGSLRVMLKENGMKIKILLIVITLSFSGTSYGFDHKNEAVSRSIKKTFILQTRNYCEDNMLTNIKADGSFHEHSAQMHVASYATVFASVTITLSYYLAGTPAKFDVNSGNYSTFLSMFKNYILPGLRGGHWDFSGLGRGITRANGIRSWMSIPQKKLIDGIDTASADLYQASIDRTTGAQSPSYAVEPNNTHFWESDYSRHIRPEFYFSMRGFSTRTVQTESGINQENLKGHYLSHGATCIMVEGDEYLNIMPVWD